MGARLHQGRACRCEGERCGSSTSSENRSGESLQANEATRNRHMRKGYLAALILLGAVPARAQEIESPKDSILDLGSMLYGNDRGGLTISSGKTYNRVEG